MVFDMPGIESNDVAPASRPGARRPMVLLALALGGAAGALALVTATAWRTHRALEAASTQRQAAYEMLVALRLLRQHIGESRVGVTGYALTRDRLYRGTYTRGVGAFGADTARLRALARRSPELTPLLEPLSPAVAAYAADLAAIMQTVEVRPREGAAAGAELRRARSTILLEGTRTHIVALEEALYRLLDESARDVTDGVRRANRVVTGALLLGGILILGAGGALVVQLRARETVQVRLRHLNEQLEARVRQRTADLAAANEELEAFASAVSHDLRTPLRAIDGFAELLLQDEAERLAEGGKAHLGKIRTASRRMGQLIEDLFTLSRASRGEMRYEPVDLSALARVVVGELRQHAPDRIVAVDIAEGVMGRGDARLLRVVLENLLGNAWKFTRDQPSPHIEFGATEGDGDTVYFVRDNGAGFDMAFADRLFAPFQRLHSAADFEGTGIGLTTVQRIISRHGGQVFAEGAVGAGAIIRFSLGERY